MIHRSLLGGSSWSRRRLAGAVAVGLTAVSLLATLPLGGGSSVTFETSGGISTISRLFSAYLTVLMTSLALIVARLFPLVMRALAAASGLERLRSGNEGSFMWFSTRARPTNGEPKDAPDPIPRGEKRDGNV